jgi:multidrug efflux pump subunit AcrA (membrane-fusion protein)
VAQSAEANVKHLEELESFKRVYAPFSGVIMQRNVDAGNLINAGNGDAATKEIFDLAQTELARIQAFRVRRRWSRVLGMIRSPVYRGPQKKMPGTFQNRTAYHSMKS